MTNPFKEYKKNSIYTMTKGELLILLFDEAVKRLNQSKILMENQDFENANIQLERIRSIFNYLIATLDDSYELSRDLANMYTFFIIETIKASSSKSIKHIDDILPIVKDLRNTWAEADVLARKRN